MVLAPNLTIWIAYYYYCVLVAGQGIGYLKVGKGLEQCQAKATRTSAGAGNAQKTFYWYEGTPLPRYLSYLHLVMSM